MQTLFDNQLTAIDKLRRYKVGALFMEPGTGKTRTAYELIRSVSECDYILWLTPFQTKRNLQLELQKWAVEDPDQNGWLWSKLEIVGIETLSSSHRTYLTLYEKIQTFKCPFIVVDESLKIKNWEAKRTKRIIELSKFSTYKLILNGTPISRNLLDVWAQMEFLSPKILNMGISEFKNTFCEWTRITKRFGHKSFSREFITKYHNVDYLYSLIGHYVYECDLEIEVQKQYHDCSYEIDEDIKQEYYRLKEKYLDDEKLLAMNNNIFLELTQKMQHLYSCTEDKFSILNNLMAANKNANILVFTKYVISAVEVSKRFPGVMVLSYQKHAHGLNLQENNVCVFFDKTWNYAERIQAEGRIFRKGQKNNCIYYDLTGNVGLESMINKNIEKKQNLLDYFKSKAVKEILKEL